MVIPYLSIAGILIAVLAIGCTDAHLSQAKDALLFGKVHWGIVGIIGYCLLIATQGIPGATKALAVVALALTAWLVYKAVKLKLKCPFCLLAWIVNLAIAISAFVPSIQPH